MKLFWIVSALGDTSCSKEERCCCSAPGCSDSSCFIDVLFWPRIGFNRRYWSNFCTAALCWGTAGTVGYGQGTVGPPGCRGCASPGCVWVHHAQQANQRRAGRAGASGHQVKAWWQDLGCCGQSACGTGAGTLISGVHSQVQAWP